MATTSNQLGRKDNTAMWTVLALIVVAVLAYAAYAYYHSAGYQRTHSSEMGSVSNTAPDTTTAPATTTNQ